MKARSALWRFVIASVVSTILLLVIANAITRPVKAATRTYNAEFTDVSGLNGGADVRVRGVAVGKVQAIELKRSYGRSIAAVRLTMDKRFSIVPSSRLAVMYQALTGLRFIDVRNPADGKTAENVVINVPTTMTQPSFDITTLFNGLQPVLATLSPEEINTFTDNALAFLQGDGNGLGPMLDSINKLSSLVANRQQVIATIVRNLATLSEDTQGRSQYLVKLLDEFELPINQALMVIDEFRKSAMSGPAFTRTVNRLLAAIGLRPGRDMSTALDRAVTNVYTSVEAIKRTPVIWDNIPPPEDGVPVPCSHGRAQLPEAMDVLLQGQRVVLCKK
jgi:phospholipid/cholesterol/gamma-HCH transport system substrate-binding protein